MTYTVLPALGCALLVAVGARVSARFSAPRALNWAVLALTGVALFVLPSVASAGLPAPEGNGRHVDESAYAELVVALGVLAVALVSALRLWSSKSRRAVSGGGRREP
ncbi:hypothetical protein ACIQF6_02665 [Kitasatospora sp. NPDC092948]|uniref:hypothetical protein n=1 Tax=Kitasatospora sp. NPDC092948 TaxID=3364088 RepID=UPI003806FBB1